MPTQKAYKYTYTRNVYWDEQGSRPDKPRDPFGIEHDLSHELEGLGWDADVVFDRIVVYDDDSNEITDQCCSSCFRTPEEVKASGDEMLSLIVDQPGWRSEFGTKTGDLILNCSRCEYASEPTMLRELYNARHASEDVVDLSFLTTEEE